MVGRALTVLLIALWSLIATSALAQSVAEKETARTLMKTGDSKFESGDYDGALQDYTAADAIMGVPVTRFAMGTAQARLGRLLEARDTLVNIANMPAKSQPEPQPFVDARDNAAALAVELEARIATVTFVVTGVNAADVSITVDGETVPPALRTAPRRVDPGDRRIEVSAVGYQTYDEVLTLADGETRELQVALVRIDTRPPGGAATVEPDDVGGSISPVTWVGFGVGAAGLIVGGVFGGIAAGQASDVKDRCEGSACPRAVEEDLDGALTLSHVSTVGFVFAGAGIALGFIGLFVLSDDAAEEVGVNVTPDGVRVRF